MLMQKDVPPALKHVSGTKAHELVCHRECDANGNLKKLP
jgi:hypothetical protein